MSSEHNSNQFLTFESEQSRLGFNDSKKDLILDMISDSNRTVVQALTKIKDDIILDGTKFFIDAQKVAKLYFDSEYSREILNDDEKSEKDFTRFKFKLNLLLESIKAQPAESKRSVQATASCSYRSSLLSNISGITDKDQNLI